MALIYLIRHGRAAAGWDADPDPGLDVLGRQQAQHLVERFEPLGPLPVVVSPMARTRETAAPLLEHWGTEPRIEPRVSEIPSPTEELAARADWLKGIAGRRYTELDDWLRDWRAGGGGILRRVAPGWRLPAMGAGPR
ncbi:MAG: histidine phosphatase family protein [Ectothiorhodospiraceae bacterium]|nr:histidine phosphatase family protein [Ectothiorhodospiraceae bacterium]